MSGSLHSRIGTNLGRRLKLEDALVWAAWHDVRFFDVELTSSPNASTPSDEERAHGVRGSCQRHGAGRSGRLHGLVLLASKAQEHAGVRDVDFRERENAAGRNRPLRPTAGHQIIGCRSLVGERTGDGARPSPADGRVSDHGHRQLVDPSPAMKGVWHPGR